MNEIELMRSIAGLEGVDEGFLGVTDDRRVVSDRLVLFEIFCCIVPRLVDIDV